MKPPKSTNQDKQSPDAPSLREKGQIFSNPSLFPMEEPNAVIGKVHRLGLSGRPKPDDNNETIRKRANPRRLKAESAGRLDSLQILKPEHGLSGESKKIFAEHFRIVTEDFIERNLDVEHSDVLKYMTTLSLNFVAANGGEIDQSKLADDNFIAGFKPEDYIEKTDQRLVSADEFQFLIALEIPEKARIALKNIAKMREANKRRVNEGVTNERSDPMSEESKLDKAALAPIFEGKLDRTFFAKMLRKVIDQDVDLSVRKAAIKAGTSKSVIEKILSCDASIDKASEVLTKLGHPVIVNAPTLKKD